MSAEQSNVTMANLIQTLLHCHGVYKIHGAIGTVTDATPLSFTGDIRRPELPK